MISNFALGLRNLAKSATYAEPSNLAGFINQCLDLGITTFDHADVYGNFTCEMLFGNALKTDPSLRSKIKLVSKCGIQIVSNNLPENKIKFYDLSRSHITRSVEMSLQRLGTDYLDLYLLHRPDFLAPIDEVTKTMSGLKDSGKVLAFGVSNFSQSQVNLLQSQLDFSLYAHQFELSVVNTDAIFNGVLDHCQMQNLRPMAYSTLSSGALFSDTASSRISEIRQELEIIAAEHGDHTPAQVAVAWILKHPANVVPVIGSCNPHHLKSITECVKINLTKQQWYKILEVSRANPVS